MAVGNCSAEGYMGAALLRGKGPEAGGSLRERRHSGAGAPHFQQAVNCGSIFSPHAGHSHESPSAAADRDPACPHPNLLYCPMSIFWERER